MRDPSFLLNAESSQTLLRRLVNYGAACPAVLAAYFLHQALSGWVGELPPYALFYTAVIAMALLAGFGSGMLATALSALLVDQWVMPPGNGTSSNSLHDLLTGTIFMLNGTLICVLIELYRRHQRRTVAYERAQMTSQLYLSEERLRMAQEAGQVGVWEYNPATGEVQCSPELERIFGEPPGTLRAYQDFARRVYPDDLEMVEVQRETAIAERRSFEYEYRIRRSNRETAWLYCRGLAHYHPDGSPSRVFGVNLDVTERKRAEEGLRKSERRLSAALEGGRMGMWEWDLRSNEVIWNAREFELLGLPASDHPIPATIYFDHVHPNDREVLNQALNEVLRHGSEYRHDHRIQLASGQERWLAAVGHLERDAQGHPLRMTGINYDVTERKQLELDLVKARIAAEAANRAKSQFLASMSHELRTPMNAILGMTDLALGFSLPPQARDFLETAKDSARQLLEILNDILDFSRIESGRFELENVAFNLAEIIQQTVQILGVRACEKGLELTHEIDDALASQVNGDPLRLRQVLINLLGNAIKFTQHGKIAIRATLEHEGDQQIRVRFAVSDTGIGISPNNLEKIFSPFTQADASTTRHFGGSGLGLAISQRLVQLMGGRIWAESEPGRGSDFYFTAVLHLTDSSPLIPTRQNQATQDKLVKQFLIDKPLPRSGLCNVLTGALGSGVPPEPSDHQKEKASVPPRPARLLKILLADDTPANQKLVIHLLSERGHQITVAQNGQEAVDLIRKQSFDVVLMDIQMPEMDGFEATRQIRQFSDPIKAQLPIVAITAHALKGDKEKCLSAGMTHYLSKPIEAREMIQLVEHLIPVPLNNTHADSANSTLSAASSPALEITASPASASLDVQPISFNLQEAISRCFGKYGIFQDMVGCFFAEKERFLEDLQNAALQKDGSAIARLTHRMLNTIVYLGFQEASRQLRQIEQMALKGELSQVESEVRQLKAQVRTISGILEPYRREA